MRLTSLLLAAAFVATSGVALADSMKASPKPGAMHSTAMKGDHMKSNAMHGSMKSDHMKPNAMHGTSMKSDHMMGSPKPKATSKP